MKVYSEDANDVRTLVNTTEVLVGVAWDPKGQQLYFSTYSTPSLIYRANADGSEIVGVFSSSTCE